MAGAHADVQREALAAAIGSLKIQIRISIAGVIMGVVQWYDARVLIVEVLCAPAQAEELRRTVSAAVTAEDDGHRFERGAWRTTGLRIRPPRDRDEAEWLRESLTQPDDPDADRRNPMVLEVGGRGSRSAFDGLSEVVRRTLCPDEFHAGPCRIPWATMFLDLKDAKRGERLVYRPLFPVGRQGHGRSR